jgi:hypothetical protein
MIYYYTSNKIIFKINHIYIKLIYTIKLAINKPFN